MPLLALPARSNTLALARVMTLVVSVTAAFGVRVAVQVMPSSDDTAVSVPFSIARSALVKPLTASLKVKVTCASSPMLSAASSIVMVTVGRTVSTA